MIHCFQCSSELPDNMIYCLHCGVKLDGEAETVFAPRYGKQFPPIPTRISSLLMVSAVLGFGIALYYFGDRFSRPITANRNANTVQAPTPSTPTPPPIETTTSKSQAQLPTAMPSPKSKKVKTGREVSDMRERDTVMTNAANIYREWSNMPANRMPTAANTRRMSETYTNRPTQRKGQTARCYDGSFEYSREINHRFCINSGGIFSFIYE